MTQNYDNARKNKQLRFMLFYFASLIIVAIISATLFTRKTDTSINDAEAKKLSSLQKQSIEADKLLHKDLQTLQALDGEYLSAITDSDLINNQARLKEAVKALSEKIADAEQKLFITIRKVEAIADSSDSNKSLTENLLPDFRKALENHKSIMMVGAAMVSSSGHSDEIVQAIGLQNELQRKDNSIRMLEEQLKKLMNEKRLPQVIAVSSVVPKNSTIENNSPDLQNINKSLKDDNDRLLKEISRYNQLVESGENVAKEKQADMNKKVKELTDELYLAQVECNISRADVKQIVYNSKQRRDLLAEALAVLNNLSQSGNANMQKKVKEKTLQLQHIANTVSD